MNAATHALTMNGRINGELKDGVDPPDLIIRKRLSLLDGNYRFSLGLWRIPDGVPFDRVDLDNWPKEYIQVAGSSKRMTVEVRRIEEGQPRQYVIGRDTLSGGHRGQLQEPSSGPDPDHHDEGRVEVIHWNGCETFVFPSEVFSADEAAGVFISYYATGWIPNSYTLRLLLA